METINEIMLNKVTFKVGDIVYDKQYFNCFGTITKIKNDRIYVSYTYITTNKNIPMLDIKSYDINGRRSDNEEFPALSHKKYGTQSELKNSRVINVWNVATGWKRRVFLKTTETGSVLVWAVETIQESLDFTIVEEYTYWCEVEDLSTVYVPRVILCYCKVEKTWLRRHYIKTLSDGSALVWAFEQDNEHKSRGTLIFKTWSEDINTNK